MRYHFFEDGAHRPLGCFSRGRLKHVDRAELDPDLAWRINQIWSVRSVMPANLKAGCFLSQPTKRPILGVMGRSKRDAEGIVQSNGEHGPAMVVRFPNIWVLQIQCFQSGSISWHRTSP